MKKVVPIGYAVPQLDVQRLADELRAARAHELANASDRDRVRIEEEISRQVQWEIKKRHLLRRWGLNL